MAQDDPAPAADPVPPLPDQRETLVRRCTALLDGLPEAILVIGAERRVLYANPAARDLFGPHAEGSQAVALLRHPDEVAALERGFARLRDGTEPAEPVEVQKVIAQASTESVFRMLVQPLDPASGITGLIVSLRDVSHVAEAEQQRRDFVANVSHELRSPLTVLAGFIETLQGPAREDPGARENFLGIMARETRRMTGLVNDLLSLSKVESVERMRPRTRVHLTEVLRATLAALRPQIEDAGIAVRFDDLDNAPEIPGDRDQLVQVFRNLIENAVKYGGNGGRIDIAVTRCEVLSGVAGPAMKVTVTDYGEGIDPIHLPRLTERFYRVDTDRSRQKGGTGLGLAIVKHIVNRHRGRLTIRSARGEGCTFAVFLPCE